MYIIIIIRKRERERERYWGGWVVNNKSGVPK